MPENETQWYVDMQNEIVGPVPLEMLREWFRVKTITSETWVRQEGQTEWQPLAMLEGFDVSEEDAAGMQELAEQPDAEKPLHYLRTQDMADTEISERDNLLNRAFGVKCIAVIIAIFGAVYVFIAFAGLVNERGASPVGAMLLCGLIAIPIAVQYYILNSISIVLRVSSELHGENEKLREMLEDRTKE